MAAAYTHTPNRAYCLTTYGHTVTDEPKINNLLERIYAAEIMDRCVSSLDLRKEERRACRTLIYCGHVSVEYIDRVAYYAITDKGSRRLSAIRRADGHEF